MPKKKVIYERARFNQRVQQTNEPVDKFITALYALAENCNYGALHDQLLRDRLVVGLRDRTLSERMQLDRDRTLEKTINMARQSEVIKNQQTDLRGESRSGAEIDAVAAKNEQNSGKKLLIKIQKTAFFQACLNLISEQKWQKALSKMW